MPDSNAPAPEPSPSPSPAPAPAPAAAPAASPAARPDWAPEKFWAADKGELNAEGLARSYSELEKKQGGLRQAHRAEFEKEIFGKRPATPDAYGVTPSADTTGELVIMDKVPADWAPEPGKTYFVPNPKDPLWSEVRGIAHAAGMDQATFDAKVVPLVAKAFGHRVPTAEEQAAKAKEFFTALGENGEQRANHVWGHLKTILGDKAAALDNLQTPEQFAALEALVEKAGGAKFSPAGTGAGGAVTETDLKARVADPRYRTDKAFYDETTAMFTKVYGTGSPAGVPMPFARH